MEAAGYHEHIDAVVALLGQRRFHLDYDRRGYELACLRVELPTIRDFAWIVFSYQTWRVLSTLAPRSRQLKSPAAWNRALTALSGRGGLWLAPALLCLCAARLSLLSLVSGLLTLLWLVVFLFSSVNGLPSPRRMDGIRAPIAVAVVEIDLGQEQAVEEALRKYARLRGEHTRRFARSGDHAMAIEARPDSNPSEGYDAIVLSKAGPGLSLRSFRVRPDPAYAHELVPVAAARLEEMLGDIPVNTGANDPMEAGDPRLADFCREELTVNMRRADGTDGGKWDAEKPSPGHTEVEISSQVVEGANFPLFRGIVHISRAELAKSGMDAAGLFAFSISYAGIKASNGGNMDSLQVLGTYGPDTVCSYTIFKALSQFDTPTEQLTFTTIRHSRGKNNSRRYSATCMKAPAHLDEHFAAQRAAGQAGRKLKPSPMVVTGVDVTSFADGSLRICTIQHVEPETSWWAEAGAVREFIKNSLAHSAEGVSALTAVLKEEAATGGGGLRNRRLSLSGPQPLIPEGEMQEYRLNDKTWLVSKILVENLPHDGDNDSAQKA
mmetsp:Transcript_111090/g.314409  ORF Transcript_111090/g.314409 Transcript_111090/m.314409 type:complete len:550 (-) Transcript_111090:2-1651(-)